MWEEEETHYVYSLINTVSIIKDTTLTVLREYPSGNFWTYLCSDGIELTSVLRHNIVPVVSYRDFLLHPGVHRVRALDTNDHP